MEQWAGRIERMTRAVGQAAAWLCVVMIALGAFNAVARYLGRFIGWDLSSNAYIELQWYLFSAVFLLAAASTLADDAHVRVDVLYGRLSRRSRDWIDLTGTFLLLIPFCLACIALSLPAVLNSWSILESSPDPAPGLRERLRLPGPRQDRRSRTTTRHGGFRNQKLSWTQEQVREARYARKASARPSRRHPEDPYPGQATPQKRGSLRGRSPDRCPAMRTTHLRSAGARPPLSTASSACHA